MKNRNLQIANLRVLAMFSVVLGHCCIIYTEGWNVYQTEYKSTFFCILKEIINGYQMHLFFSVSGFLFYYSYKKYNFLKLIRKKGQRILVPFLFIGLFWLVPIRYLAKYPLYEDDIIEGYYTFFLGNWGHLWFLPTLFLIFILVYIFLQISKRINLPVWGGMLGAFVLMVIAKRLNIPSLLANVFYWHFYFLLGFFFCKIGFSYNTLYQMKYGKSCFWILSIAFVLLYIIRIIVDSNFINLFSSIVCVCFLYQIIPSKHNKVLAFFDDYSMGIYLFHAPIIYLLYYFFSNRLLPIYLVGMNFFISVLCSIFLTYLLRRMHLSFFLGEKS